MIARILSGLILAVDVTFASAAPTTAQSAKFKAIICAIALCLGMLSLPNVTPVAQATCTLYQPVTPAVGSPTSPTDVWGNFNALAACGLNSVTAGPSGNVTASTVSGAVTVDAVENPTFTGVVTGAGYTGGPVSGTTGTFSSLTSGQCVQASTAGLLTTVGAACGSGGGSSFTTTVQTTNATAFSATGTGSNSITSASTTGPAFVLNNTSGSSITLFSLQSAGTPAFTIAAGTVAILGTSANAFTSSTTGANTAFVFNANGASPTGDLADFQLSGTTNASISNNGKGNFVGVAVGGALTGATTAAFSGTVTNSAASPQETYSATTGTQINSAQAAADSFAINTTTTSTNTTSMFEVENNGTEKFEVGSGGNVSAAGSGSFGGGVAVGGALTGATTGSFLGTVTFSNNTGGITQSGAGAGISATANTGAAMLFTSDVTGANDVFAFQDANATPATGNLVDFETTGGTKVARISEFGGFCPGNGTTNAAQSPCLYAGAGVPSFSAANASIYMDYSGTPGTNIFYVNTSGALSSGTTWTAKF